jgi:hypothetical protein
VWASMSSLTSSWSDEEGGSVERISCAFKMGWWRVASEGRKRRCGLSLWGGEACRAD